jgi:hypothetical protein
MSSPNRYALDFIINDLQVCPRCDASSPSHDPMMGLHKALKFHLQLVDSIPRFRFSKSGQLIAKGLIAEARFMKQYIRDVGFQNLY